MMNLYFDNASTSYPKPQRVLECLACYYESVVGSYGRSLDGRTLLLSMQVERLRESLARLLGVSKPEHVIYTQHATEAANLILRGLDLRGYKVWVSPLEHNAIMRPLKRLQQEAELSVQILPHQADGEIDIALLEQLELDSRSFVIINMMSNVNGLVQDLSIVAPWLKSKGCMLMLDLTQYLHWDTPLPLEEWDVDYAILTGHKGLLSPTGMGAAYIKEPRLVAPLITGGNGYKSALLDLVEESPERYEAGTPNMLSLVAAYAAGQALPERRLSKSSWLAFLDRLEGLPLRLLRARHPERQGYLASFTLDADMGVFASQLYHSYGCLLREGLHCAPLAHQSLKSFPLGAIRIAPSPYFHTAEDLDFLFNAIKGALTKV